MSQLLVFVKSMIKCNYIIFTSLKMWYLVTWGNLSTKDHITVLGWWQLSKTQIQNMICSLQERSYMACSELKRKRIPKQDAKKRKTDKPSMFAVLHLGHVHTWCPSAIIAGHWCEHTIFSRTHPRMQARENKVETLYSGTKVGAYILGTRCLNTAPYCAGAQALVLGHQVWTWP